MFYITILYIFIYPHFN